jgi:hypothetical protein
MVLLLQGIVGNPECILASDSQTSGVVRGQVIWRGDVPDPVLLPVDRDGHVCGRGGRIQVSTLRRHPGTGGLQGAVVTMTPESGSPRSGDRFRAPATGVMILETCLLRPNLVAVRPGGNLSFFAADSGANDLRLDGPGGTVRRIELGMALARHSVRLDRPGVWQVTTPGRPFARSHVLVTDAPYVTVTDSRGSWSFSEVPAGRWRVRAFHTPVRWEAVRHTGRVVAYETEPLLESTRVITVGREATANVLLELSQ